MFFFFCIFLYYLILTSVQSESCGIKNCIACGNFHIVTIDCKVLNFTSNVSVITCDFNSTECSRYTDSPSLSDSHDLACYFELSHEQEKWMYKPYYLILGTEPNCGLKCPDHYQLNSYEEIFERRFECGCYEDDCNIPMNITITLDDTSTVTTQSSTNALSGTSSVTPVVSSVNSSFTASQTQHSMTANTVLHTKTTITISTVKDLVTDRNFGVSSSSTSIDLREKSTSEDHRQVSSSSTSIDQRVNIITDDSQDNRQVFIGIIAALSFALIVIMATLLLTTCTFLYRMHVSKRTHHSLHHVHINSPFPIYDLDLPPDNPITVLNNIGYGKFGSVYKALYNGSPVAVKIFDSQHRSSWDNERKLYALDSTTHKHILHYIGSQERSAGPRKQLYMITEYHALGSLNHYLQHNTLTWPQTLKIINSVSSGLAHLHSSAYVSSEGSIMEKFAMAHRDVKSANVLVKDDSGHCVLGDLGLALILDPEADDRKIANSGQVGTYRYMAPEALDARVNLRDLESFKQIDVYALALVLWEVCTRCEVGDSPVPPCQSPYFSIVGERPTLEMMKEVVVLQKNRPDIVGCWHSHPGLKQVISVMEESWDEDPEARLTAANIVSRLETLERTLRTEEIVKEVKDSFKGEAIPGSSSHKKVEVSSSFAGNSNRHPPVLHTRLSVDNTVPQNNTVQTFQRYPRRYSLTNHHEQMDKDLAMTYTKNLTQTPPRANSPTICPQSHTESQYSHSTHDPQVVQNEQHQSHGTLNVDAATGQPKRNDDLSSLNNDSIHSSDDDN